MFSLAFYTIRIRDLYTGDVFDLDRLPLQKDFLHEVKAALDLTLSQAAHQGNKVFRAVSARVNGRQLSGIVETGEYGFESKIAQVRSENEQINVEDVFSRKKDQAEMLPFYYLIRAPQGQQIGYIVLQRFKQYGIKDYFEKFLGAVIARRFDSLVVEFRRVLPRRAFDEMLSGGTVKAFRFLRKNPKDVADALKLSGFIEAAHIGELEVKLRAKRGTTLGGLNFLSNFLDANEKSEVIEFAGEAYDSLKVDVEIDGRPKTLNYNRIKYTIGNIDITNRVSVGDNGHPVYASVDAISKELLGDLNFLVNGYDRQD